MISHHPCRFRSTVVAATALVFLGLNLGPALAAERPSAARKLVRVGLDVGRRLVAPLRTGAARLGDVMRVRRAAKPKLVRTPKRFLRRLGRGAVVLVTLAALLTSGYGCAGLGRQVKHTNPAGYEFARQATGEARKPGLREYEGPKDEYMEQHARFSQLFERLRANPSRYEKDPPPELNSARKVEKYMEVNFGYPDYPSAVHASKALDLLSLVPTAPGREGPIQVAIRRVARYKKGMGGFTIADPFSGEELTIPLDEPTLPIPQGAVSVAQKMGMKVVGPEDGVKGANGLRYIEMIFPEPPPDAIKRDT